MAIEPGDLRSSNLTKEATGGVPSSGAPSSGAPSGGVRRAPNTLPRQVTAAPQKKRSVWPKIGLGALLLAACAGAYGTMTQHGRDTVKTVTSGFVMATTMKQHPTLIFDEANSDHVNILLIGRDVNWKQGKVYDPKTKTYRKYQVHDDTELARSDTMIVVSLDKTRNTIRMVSLPRDAIVHFPPNEFERKGKLNAAHAYGGPQFLIKTLHDELGLTIHHYAVVKFEGFKKLIDQVGGVEVKVDGALKRDKRTGKLYRGNLDYDDKWGNLHIHLKPGLQRLDGEAAHNYVRFRMDREGDPGRIRRQQDVMRALAKQIMHASPLAIPGLVKEFRLQFQTDLTDEMLGSAAQFAQGLGNSAKIQPLTLFGVYDTRGSITLNKTKNEKLLAAVFGPTFKVENFLQHSPTTEDDEIGLTNDSNAAAQEVLREAGLLKDKNGVTPPREMTAPVRVEPSRDEETSDPGERRSARLSRRSRKTTSTLSIESSSAATESNDSPSASNDSAVEGARGNTTTGFASTDTSTDATPSRSRRRRDAASRETADSKGDAQNSDSPVPAPEHELSVEESPIPQPE